MPTVAPTLHAIDYVAGTPVPVQSLADHGFPIETVDALLDKGVHSFAVLDQTLDIPLRACTRRALDKAGIGGDEIDAVILVTESFSSLFESGESESFRQIRNRAFTFFQEAGINKASLFCATYGGCTNFLQAALTARTLVQQGLSRHVLLVAAERFPTLASRLMDEAVSLAGDGVAACVISAAAPADTGFRLDFVSLAPYRNMTPGADLATMLLEMFRSMKHAAADCYDACRMQPGDYRWIVLGDYNRNTTLTYSKLLGFPPERAFIENVGRYGHIPFDPLINLADLLGQGHAVPGDAVLLFLCGPVSCGAVSVTLC